MFQYRQILLRLRQGDTDRQIARSHLMGRRKVAAFRALCRGRGWLDPDHALPDDATVAATVGAARRAPAPPSPVPKASVSSWLSGCRRASPALRSTPRCAARRDTPEAIPPSTD